MTTQPRLMLTLYVDNDEDAQRVFDALQTLKETGVPQELARVPTLDWDTEWEEADEDPEITDARLGHP